MPPPFRSRAQQSATLIIALGGIPLGYLLARLPGRAMATVGFLVQLPLALPPLASGILLLFLVGYSSPIGQLTSGALTDSFAGIVIAEIFRRRAVFDHRRTLGVRCDRSGPRRMLPQRSGADRSMCSFA